MVYTRKNQRNLTSAERKAFVNAVLELKRRGAYDTFVRTHIDFYVSDGDRGLRVAHMAPSFLPWHRQFLLEFERALQKVNPRVTVPYWDWTRDNSPASSLWGDDFMGGNGRRGDLQVMTGPFAHAHGNWDITANVTDERFLTRDLGRPKDPIKLPAAADVAHALADPVYDVSPWNSMSGTGFRNKMEGWTTASGNARFRTHNQVHRWIGGIMLGGAAVNDPVFWLHHAFVDSLWSRWQAAHPKSKRYLPDVPPPLGDLQHGRVAALHDPMPPWNVAPAALLDHSRIYRYA
ncbi:tyrosinase family protein [Streptomyces sp. ASQP_92]|uniref:tyrosinase family protein n=1 Tax=Streptomyces sp. ASQP_92 TaxID=2979116 RepID=UPI0021BFDB5E|nr:tyrosinase family protein [Streptomyces sp. ASQP_92]MCT9093079.1 tyrosinase family protein [Streptomyces sp. ASQP_92]